VILYHFTGLRELIGADGLDALASRIGEDVDLATVAAPGSILVDGLKPHKDNGYDGALRTPLPPCIWFTNDPRMPEVFARGGDFRIRVVISNNDRCLKSWRSYYSKHVFDLPRFESVTLSVPGAAAAAARFFLYFGAIPASRLRVVERPSIPPRRGPPKV
jgi:hypothetical protein